MRRFQSPACRPFRWGMAVLITYALGFFLLAVSAASAVEGTVETPGAGQRSADQGKMTSVLLDDANTAYQQGEYQRAIDLYQLVMGRGVKNGYLYFNLGNAYQRLELVGPAIQNYLIARLYLPRDSNVKANLEYARARAQDKIEPGEPSWMRRLVFWYDRVSDFELVGATVVLGALFWIFLTARWYKPRPVLRLLILLAGLGALLSGGTAAHHAYRYAHSPSAVVLEEEVSVRSGTDVNAVRLFLLHAGTEVRTGEKAGDWIRIELPDGKRGWVESRFVGLVVP